LAGKSAVVWVGVVTEDFGGTTPTRGRAGVLQAASHVSILAVLAAHGKSVALGLAAIATVVRPIATNVAFATTAAVNARSVIAVKRPIASLCKSVIVDEVWGKAGQSAGQPRDTAWNDLRRSFGRILVAWAVTSCCGRAGRRERNA